MKMKKRALWLYAIVAVLLAVAGVSHYYFAAYYLPSTRAGPQLPDGSVEKVIDGETLMEVAPTLPAISGSVFMNLGQSQKASQCTSDDPWPKSKALAAMRHRKFTRHYWEAATLEGVEDSHHSTGI